jgi:uncharacterized phiE125 gp8 family phage protein
MLIVTTAATVEPVTLAEAKAHLRVTHTSDDALIGALITAAREDAEQITGRALAAASYRWASSETVSSVLRLPLWPVSAVTALTYEDADGARQTMASGDYTLDSDRSTVTIDPLPDFIANVSVAFDVAPDAVPETCKSAIKMLVEHMYAGTDRTAADRLLHLQRVNLGV